MLMLYTDSQFHVRVTLFNISTILPTTLSFPFSKTGNWGGGGSVGFPKATSAPMAELDLNLYLGFPGKLVLSLNIFRRAEKCQPSRNAERAECER